MWSEVLVSEERKEVQGQCKDILESQWEEAQAPCILGWKEAGDSFVGFVCGAEGDTGFIPLSQKF